MIDGRHLIVGTGYAAQFVLRVLSYLFQGKHDVIIISRYPDKNAHVLSQYPNSSITNLQNALGTFDTVWLAVPDSQIAYYATQLQVESDRWIHLSGATEITRLHPHQESGMVVWPIVSLAAPYRLEDVPLVIESWKDDRFAELLLNAFPRSLRLSYSERLVAHMAATVSNNFVHHLHTMLEEELITENINKEILNPIIEQTFERIKQGNLKQSLTGPARRRDHKTIHKHLSILKSNQLREIYQVLTKSIQSLYESKL